MGDKSKIEWTDATWNPIRGCTRVSEGCRHCYAEQVAARFAGPGLPYEGLVTLGPKGARWNGTIREVPQKLDEPVRWTKPRMIFVNSMSDLFHDGLDDAYIAAVFGAMLLARHHVYQVLTKRPERMVKWLERELRHGPDVFARDCVAEFHRRSGHRKVWVRPTLDAIMDHVMLGVSIEDQESAEQRLPFLAELHRKHLRFGATLWTSYEPALGRVDFRKVPDLNKVGPDRHPILDWVVCGGESGRGARPFDLTWAKSTIDQCQAAGVACFIKQFGAHPVLSEGGFVFDQIRGDHHHVLAKIKDTTKGAVMEEWPSELRVRQFPRMARFDLSKGATA